MIRAEVGALTGASVAAAIAPEFPDGVDFLRVHHDLLRCDVPG
jgi:hypothetical protein